MIKRVFRYLAFFSVIRSKIGLFGALKYSVSRLLSKGLNVTLMIANPDPVESFKFICAEPFGDDDSVVDRKVINWIIPDFGIGSGGHLNIFRVIKKLEEKGLVCRINIDGKTHFTSGDDARKCIRENFFPIDAEVSLGRSGLMAADATFATGWTTAYTVRDFRGAGKKYYFVQDFEPYFFAQGSEYSFAEETYRFGFKAITAGAWLSDKLSKNYNMEAIPFGFSYDRELYFPRTRLDVSKKRIFFYARSITPRRAFELGLLALSQVHKADPEIEFVLAGWDMSGYEIPFPFQNAGVVSIDELPDLYSQCDLALVISLTNLSLLPLEVMACGCAVVSNKGPNVEWLLDEAFTKFSNSSPEALSDAMLDLVNDPVMLDKYKKEGLKFAQSTNWNAEVDKIASIIESDVG